jgi:hypothetical protein
MVNLPAEFIDRLTAGSQGDPISVALLPRITPEFSIRNNAWQWTPPRLEWEEEPSIDNGLIFNGWVQLHELLSAFLQVARSLNMPEAWVEALCLHMEGLEAPDLLPVMLPDADVPQFWIDAKGKRLPGYMTIP